MERQLQERLLGAAVLIVIAVILVPEMFSGTHSRSSLSASGDASNAGQLKTIQIDLQSATVSAPAVQASAPVPVEASQAVVAAVTSSSESSSVEQVAAPHSESSSHSSEAVSSAPPVAVVAHPVATPDKPVLSEAKKTAHAKLEQWVVQIGSFSTKERAQQVIGKLASMGLKASQAPIKSGNKTLYRVRSAAIADRDEAMTALKKIEATYPGASVVSLR